MNRQCDLCERPAVVHEITVRNGVKKETHLCEHHAGAMGVAMPGNQPMDEILEACAKTKLARPLRSTRRVCRTCGLKFTAFRQSGLLGCSACYDAFEAELGPMIERAQNGGASHAGKCPERGGASIDGRLQIERLVRELEDAVAAEQYERAAELRDRMHDLRVEISDSCTSNPQSEGQAQAPDDLKT